MCRFETKKECLKVWQIPLCPVVTVVYGYAITGTIFAFKTERSSSAYSIK
jgi:hypothetical protein